MEATRETSTLTLRSNLRKYGFNSLANAITQTGNEYHRARDGKNTVPGGMMGAYARWQDAIQKGHEAMRSLNELSSAEIGKDKTK